MLKLNPEQLQAVEHGDGPLLVIAGPGSGKTRVITQRIVHLLEHAPGLEPQNILALTFTEKAAGEMKYRVGQALPDLATFPHVSTFHAFAYEVVCKQKGEQEPAGERMLLDKEDVWVF
ncbi:MAG: UvrD-helicase domain-containing protein, partial [Terriglobia bacterium]